ncbi:N(G):N(G)-dimethylarginine dimethylaminohydrolase 1-like protein, partial [Dinothrombium tinctorium]
VETTRAIIKKELNLPIIEIADTKATLDGGDVLFTGREFFVGISKRTNEAGARAVAAAFPEFPVTPVPVPKKLLHLKSYMSMAGPNIICVGSSPEAQSILKTVEREATFRYNTLTVPDDIAANVLFVNGTLVYRSEFPNSTDVIESRVDYPRKAIKIWELSKPQGSLTCLSILVKKSKIIKI